MVDPSSLRINGKSHILWYLQVLLSTILRTKATGEEFVISTTHFKAKCNPLLMMIRREQSKDLLSHVNQLAEGRPIIVSGDFNAEPSEPAYQVMTLSDKPRYL
jgi:nocturnin